MALLKILHHPDPELRKIAQPLHDFGKETQTMIDDMFETMYDARGLGLAATQVGIHLRLAVMDVAENDTGPLCIVNPEIISGEGVQTDHHGCLSVPGGPGVALDRFAKIRVKALDRHGKPIEFSAEGTLAICVQHELDHLNGKLYIDHLSPLKRERLLKKIAKANR